MNKLMEEDGNSKLPDDYTNRVLTDMLLEMVKVRQFMNILRYLECVSRSTIFFITLHKKVCHLGWLVCVVMYVCMCCHHDAFTCLCVAMRVHARARAHTHTHIRMYVQEGSQAEKRAWELFNKLRETSKVNIIHYNVSVSVYLYVYVYVYVYVRELELFNKLGEAIIHHNMIAYGCTYVHMYVCMYTQASPMLPVASTSRPHTHTHPCIAYALHGVFFASTLTYTHTHTHTHIHAHSRMHMYIQTYYLLPHTRAHIHTMHTYIFYIHTNIHWRLC